MPFSLWYGDMYIEKPRTMLSLLISLLSEKETMYTQENNGRGWHISHPHIPYWVSIQAPDDTKITIEIGEPAA